MNTPTNPGRFTRLPLEGFLKLNLSFNPFRPADSEIKAETVIKRWRVFHRP